MNKWNVWVRTSTPYILCNVPIN